MIDKRAEACLLVAIDTGCMCRMYLVALQLCCISVLPCLSCKDHRSLELSKIT